MAIEIYDNFLDEELCDVCLETALDVFKSGKNELFCNQHFWDARIVRDSFPVLGHNIYKTTPLFSTLKDIIESKSGKQIKDSIMFYYWTTFSYIPWHSDGDFAGGFTIYLNDFWDKDWGGYLLYKDVDESIKGIVPKRNRAIFQQGGTHHMTTPVSFDGKLRISIQTFLVDK